MTGEGSVSNETEQSANAAPAQEAVETESKATSEVNERLLAESKKYKKAAQEYKSQLEAAQNAKLQEEAKFKELWQKSEEKYQGLYKSLVKEKIKTAVTEKASKAGAVDVEAVMKLGNPELLQVEDETLEVHGVESFVEELKKQKPYLFQTAKAQTINATTPGGVVAKKTLTANDLARRKLGDPEKQAIWMTAFKNTK